ncbi:carboxypeptidase-like regulatory domain-containing protein [Rapidithrix thailandica]|uniref:Carboxypeptidase-like regulatory domain-containing protein n=1 Tax=Rapidithrix thailandica TaxID=413964 RepID=A0AAW9S7M9_9BACT
MKFIPFLFYLIILFSTGCKKPSTHKAQYLQGIEGQVIWKEGNFMPGPAPRPGEPSKKQKTQGVEREILIYALTQLKQTQRKGAFFTQVSTELIKTVKSDTEGRFRVGLPAGQYSVFVKEEQGLYANFFDGKGHIHPIEVKEGEYTTIQITIDYKAAY